MSNVRDAMHTAHREGDSLKARFFRWKDKVSGGRSIADILPDFLRSGPEIFPKAHRARVAISDLLDHQDDEGAYRSAVSAFRELAVALKDLGGDIDPDVPD